MHCRAVASTEGNIVNKYALAATLALVLCGAVQAAAIDLDTHPAGTTAGAAGPQAAPTGTAVLGVPMSELPEPEVFAMMLVGLVLIGYRARRDSSDKFK
jgi:hypothetical protein